MRWQRVARPVVAAIGLMCAAAVLMYSHRRTRPVAPTTTAAIDPTATSQQSGVVNFHFKNSKEELKIEAARQTEYSDGRTRLEHVTFTTTTPDRTFEISADMADGQGKAITGDQPGQIALNGRVRIKASDGLELKTDSGTYDNIQGFASIPGKVTFTRDRLSGESMGATYDHGHDVISLLDQAHVVRGADDQGAGAIDASAKSITIARTEKFVSLSEHAKIVQAEQTLEADNAVLHFTDDEHGIQLVEMRGHSSVTPGPGAKTAPPEMGADDINLEFQPDGHTLRHATLTGKAKLVQLDDQGSKELITAATIDAVTAPDGRTLTSLQANTAVEVILPATADAPGRTIQAPSLVAGGDDKTGLKTALFEGGVSFQESQKAGRGRVAVDRTAKSTTLTLDLKGQLGAIEKAEFRQNVTFKDGDMLARADIGSYDETHGSLLLTPAKASLRASVDDPSVHVDALWIQIDLATHNLAAKDSVATRMVQSQAPGAVTHAPALFDGNQPVYGSAAELTYVSSSKEAKFGGTPTKQARVYQENTNNVVGDRLELAQETGNLTATGNVASRFLLESAASQPATKPPAKKKETPPTKATASAMTYTDDNRKAVYTGDASKLATLDGPDGRVEGQRLDVTLAQKERSLEQLEATGDVFATLEGGREAVGKHLIYEASTGKYVITGTPMSFKNVDAKEGRCTLETSTELTYNEQTHSMQEPPSATGAMRTSNPIACGTPLKVALKK